MPSWRSRGSVPFDKCVEIADEHGLSVDWVIQGRGQRERSDEVQRLTRKPSPTTESIYPEACQVPIYNIRVAAGDGLTVSDESKVGHLFYRTDWLIEHGIDPVRAGHFRVKGPSMEDVFQDGDLVLVDFSSKEIVSGMPYALRQDNELVIKYLSHTPDEVIVSSENAALFPAYRIPIADFANGQAEIIGRVCTHSHVWL